MSTPQNPIVPNYQPAPAVSPSFWTHFPIYYGIYVAVFLFPTTLLLAFFCLVVPRAIEVCKDFKTTLPVFTQLTFTLARIVQAGFWIPMLLLAFTFPILLAWMTASQPDRAARKKHVFFVLLPLVIFTIIMIALGALAIGLPMIKLTQSATSGEGNP